MSGDPYDPYWSNVSSLLHLDGSDGDFSSADETGLSWTWSTGTRLDDAQKKFGATSLELNGYLSRHITASDASLAMGTGDFTIEGWFRADQSSAGDYIFDCGSSSFRLLVDLLKVRYLDPGLSDWSTSPLYTDGPTVSAGTWYHFAVTRSGTTVRAFLDGTQWGSDTSSYNDTSNAFYYGRRGDGITSSYFFGWLDELRITKGVARYTSNFTAPTAAFPGAWTELYLPLPFEALAPNFSGADAPALPLVLAAPVFTHGQSIEFPALALSLAAPVLEWAVTSNPSALALPFTLSALPEPTIPTPPQATRIYRCVISYWLDAAWHHVQVTPAALQVVYSYGQQTYVSASFHDPDPDLVDDLSTADPEFTKLRPYAGWRLGDDENLVGVASVDVSSVRTDVGAESYSLTISGYSTAAVAPKEHTMAAANWQAAGSGQKVWRGPIDFNLRPGDKALWLDGTEQVVKSVSYAVQSDAADMTVTELTDADLLAALPW